MRLPASRHDLQDGQLPGIEEVQRWQPHTRRVSVGRPADEAALVRPPRLAARRAGGDRVCGPGGRPKAARPRRHASAPPSRQLRGPGSLSHTDDVFADLLALYDGFHVEAVHSNFHSTLLCSTRTRNRQGRRALQIDPRGFHDTIECIDIFWDHFDAFDLEDDEDGDFNPHRRATTVLKPSATPSAASSATATSRASTARCYVGPCSPRRRCARWCRGPRA